MKDTKMKNLDVTSKPNPAYRFWLNDPEGDGLTYYRTKEDRDAAAEVAINDYLNGEWSEEVEWVVGGEVTHIAEVKDRVLRPDDLDDEQCDGEGTYWGDYLWRGNYSLEPIASPSDVTKASPPSSIRAVTSTSSSFGEICDPKFS